MVSSRRWFLALAAATIAALTLPATASAAPSMTLVASGLDSPRGITFYHGQLLVAEAGHGGPLCVPAGPTGEACIGNTSQISRVNLETGTHTPILSGMFSLSLGAEGTLGITGLAVSDGRLLAQISATPQELVGLPIGEEESGRLIAVHGNGTWSTVAQVGKTDFDYTLPFTEPVFGVYSPGTQEHDANPTNLLATGDGVYVADSGSNTLDRVSEEGRIRILLHDGWRDPNPNNFPSDAVPTCVARGDDGLLVGELSGRLLKVEGSSFTPIEVKDSAGNSLLTHVTGCTSDSSGNVYFVNMFGAGAPFTPPPASSFFIGNVVKYNPESGKASVLAGGLHFPYDDVVGPDGNLYVTVGNICPSTGVPAPPCFGGTGGVLKIALPHGDD